VSSGLLSRRDKKYPGRNTPIAPTITSASAGLKSPVTSKKAKTFDVSVIPEITNPAPNSIPERNAKTKLLIPHLPKSKP
jgi:hypothetical protein